MAYKNVRLPRGEERVFNLPVWGGIKESYSSFTIDEEKDYVLLKGTVDKDNPSEKPFYFYFKGEIISLLLNGDEFVDKNTVKWKLLSINIPGSLDRGEVFEELRKAFKVYGIHGYTDKMQEIWRRKFDRNHPNGFAVTDF